MRLSHRVEFDFLRFAGELLSGRYTGPRRVVLASARDGLVRGADGRPEVLVALEPMLAKAVVRELCDGGGMHPIVQVARGRSRPSRLCLAPLSVSLMPLRFGEASFRLLEALHDAPPDRAVESLTEPSSLAEMILFHRVARALGSAVPDALVRKSPLSELESGGPERVRDRVGDLLEVPGGREVLRCRTAAIASSWAHRVRRAWALPGEAQARELARVGGLVGQWTGTTLEAAAQELLGAPLRFYRKLLCEIRSPQAVLEESARTATGFRKVSDQEAFLDAAAAVFAPASALAREAGRLDRVPSMEREEPESVFAEEYRRIGADPVGHALALHAALARRLA